MPNPIQQRERLLELRKRLSTAREKRAQARAARDAAGDDLQMRAAAEVALATAQGEIELVQEIEVAQLRGLSGMDSYGRESFAENPELVATLEGLAYSSAPLGAMQLGAAASREIWSGRFRRVRSVSTMARSRRSILTLRTVRELANIAALSTSYGVLSICST